MIPYSISLSDCSPRDLRAPPAALRIMSTGGSLPVHSRTDSTAWRTSISRPPMLVCSGRLASSRSSGSSAAGRPGRRPRGRRAESAGIGDSSSVPVPCMPIGVQLTMRSGRAGGRNRGIAAPWQTSLDADAEADEGLEVAGQRCHGSGRRPARVMSATPASIRPTQTARAEPPTPRMRARLPSGSKPASRSELDEAVLCPCCGRSGGRLACGCSSPRRSPARPARSRPAAPSTASLCGTVTFMPIISAERSLSIAAATTSSAASCQAS